MLQAVFAQPGPRFTLSPDSLTLIADSCDTVPPAAEVELVTSETLDWAAETSDTWLTVTPISGTTAIKPTVSVVTATLSTGWQQGVITFTATSGDPFSDTLTVDVYYGTIQQVYLPFLER
jgi:hypothetical protein